MQTSQTIDRRSGSPKGSGVTDRTIPKGPSPSPILGWTPQQNRFWRDPVAYVDVIYKKYGLLSALGSQSPRWVFSFAPEYNQRLMEDSESFHVSSRMEWNVPNTPLAVLRWSMGNRDGEDYRMRRLIMTSSAFNHSWVSRWRDSMVSVTERAISRWGEGEVIDLHETIWRLIHNFSMKVTLGVEKPQEVARIYKVVQDLFAQTLSFSTWVLPYDLPGTPYRRMLGTVAKMVDTLQELITEKRARNAEPTDMLAAMIAARTQQGEALTDFELISEIYDVMNHETTMSALVWTIFLLIQHPTVHADLVDELTGALHGEAPTMQDLERLPLLDRVVKEGLRLMPPQAFTRRFTSKPLSYGPYDLPEGAMIVLSSFITHRLPSIYDEPLRFYPQRWETINPSFTEYFPFGGPKHHCFGQMLGILEVKIVLATLLQRLGMQLLPNQRIDRKTHNLLLLRPKGAVNIKLSKQNRQFRSSPVRGQILDMVDLT
jgi:cytochrome P450